MNRELDWRAASSQLLRVLRGKRSQIALSRRLGYRSNVACDWEAGRRLPTAVEALLVCARVGIDVPAAFSRFQPACARALGPGPEFHVHSWLREMAGSSTVTELASRSGMPRLGIGRWLRGKTRPRLHDFLALVEAISGRASDLVDALVTVEAVPALLAVHQQRAASKTLAFDEPWSPAVLRVLETEGYRKRSGHEPGYIAGRLGLSPAQEATILARLARGGVVQQQQSQRYEPGTPLTVDTQASPEDVRKMRTHWTDVCRDRIQDPRPDDWLGFNLVSTSAQDLEHVREVLRRAFREIRAIAAASEPAQSVALLNLHLVTWNREP